jgi:hypothetical protein
VRRVREECALSPGKKEKRLPRLLSADDFKKFYQALERAGNTNLNVHEKAFSPPRMKTNALFSVKSISQNMFSR